MTVYEKHKYCLNWLYVADIIYFAAYFKTPSKWCTHLLVLKRTKEVLHYSTTRAVLATIVKIVQIYCVLLLQELLWHITHYNISMFYVFVRIWYATLWWLWFVVCDGLLDLTASCIRNKVMFINAMEYCLWLAVFADCCLEYVRVPVFFVIPTKMPPLDLHKTEGLLPCPNSLKKKIVRLRLLN